MSEDKPRYSVKKSWQRLKPEDLTYSVGERPMDTSLKQKLEEAKQLLGNKASKKTACYTVSGGRIIGSNPLARTLLANKK